MNHVILFHFICIYSRSVRVALHYILMGDVVASSRHNARELREAFMGLVSTCNRDLAPDILSPYTVTLRDEFQGVARSLGAAVKAILHFEHLTLLRGLSFKIRYVTVQDEIDTHVDRLKAHAMMGPGLTKARAILTDKGRGTPRFRFDLPARVVADQLNRLFLVLDGLSGRWDIDDSSLILEMLHNRNNQEVGTRFGKDRSQIWKRRKHLLVEEYRALQTTILEIGQ